MKSIRLILSVVLLWNLPAMALDVGDISSFILPDKNTLGKEIKNTTDSGRLITVRVERLSSPLDGGNIIPMETPGEILLTPSRLLLPAQSSDNIRFFFKGPDDEKERYYRIIWTDQALSDVQNESGIKNAVATTSARIGTILVVSPRKVNYQYYYNDGVIRNRGNATLRIIAYGPCLKGGSAEGCNENYFLLPGHEKKFSRVNIAEKKTRIALWQGEQFVSLK